MKERVNAHVDASSEASDLNFDLGLPLLPYFVYLRSESSGETCACTCSSELSLLADAVSTKRKCARPFIEYK